MSASNDDFDPEACFREAYVIAEPGAIVCDGRAAVVVRRASRATEFSPRASPRDHLPDLTATGPIR